MQSRWRAIAVDEDKRDPWDIFNLVSYIDGIIFGLGPRF